MAIVGRGRPEYPRVAVIFDRGTAVQMLIAGRIALRERTMIEHKLAHIAQRQGTHARYVGVRKNTFDLRRASAI
jgi:hypothetical protein